MPCGLGIVRRGRPPLNAGTIYCAPFNGLELRSPFRRFRLPESGRSQPTAMGR